LFFREVFGEATGWAVIVLPNYQGKPATDVWFEYPQEIDRMVDLVENKKTGDVWYSPILYTTKERTKATAKETQIAGADADSCDPGNFRMQPSITVQTSDGHWHVYWKLDKPYKPSDVAALNRRIAQVHKDQGCDTAYVNAAKLLRVPNTSNNKHPGAVVIVSDFEDVSYTMEELDELYPASEVPDQVDVAEVAMPDDLADFIKENRASLLNGLPNNLSMRELLFGKFHDEKRSEVLFKLCVELFQLGLDAKQVAAIAWGAPANKFNGSDPRGLKGLWDTAIMRAQAAVVAGETDEYDEDKPDKPVRLIKETQDFLTIEEREELVTEVNFIDEWTAWAASKTDAPIEYHRAAAIIVLSNIYSEFGYVQPKFGKLKLNIWMIVLGRTTKDRKTTAQRYAARMLRQLTTDDFSYLLPDDATPGGLNIVLQDRPNKPSTIMRDEVQGFFEEMVHQSYMAGGISYFTKLYDGESGGRARASGDKKITPSVPISFIFFMVGILEDTAEVLTVRNYKQGFLTRFLYVVAERPDDYEEPEFEFANDEEEEETDEVFNSMAKRLAVNRNYWEMRGGDKKLVKINIDEQAIKRFQDFRKATNEAARESGYAEILDSVTERMTLSTLKLAALLAMDERSPRITLRHMLMAISYAGEWFDNSVKVASMISESEWQRDVDKLEDFINSKGGKISYAVAYRAFANKKPFEFDEMVNALEQRGILYREGVGNRWMLEVRYNE